MSDDNALPNKTAETDSTPPPIAQPDRLAPDPTAIPAPMNLMIRFWVCWALTFCRHYSRTLLNP